MEKRTTNDICNDINQILEDYEKDNVFIIEKKMQLLKDELFISLMKVQEKNEKVDSSFVELVHHLCNSVNYDNDIDFEHIGIYKGLYCMIEYIFPSVDKYYMGNIDGRTYNELFNKKEVVKVKRRVK